MIMTTMTAAKIPPHVAGEAPSLVLQPASPLQPVETIAPQASSAARGGSSQSANTAIGVYTGPGAVAAHDAFAQWLGRPVPYATDYIDYKGGWQKDFIDSQAWLMGPWGKWVSQAQGRRLVLGVPMLENQNQGQFAEGTGGAFDPYFSSLASELVSNNLGNSIIRLGYEANCDSIGPWQATADPDGYKALFRHEVAVMRSVPGAAFSFDWTVCNGLQDGHPLNSFNSFYPGDDVVNIVGMDIYDVKWQDAGAGPQQRWDYAANRSLGINELVAFARSHGKPVSYPEWGLYKPGDSFAGGGDDPDFVQKMNALFTTPGATYQSYFDLDWGGGVLSDFPQGQAAFKHLFGN
jgi:Glycosyl hydrolase family 26